VRLVAVSAVQFQSGLRMPLEEMGRLCQRYGAELFVDAIQALGAVPLDVDRCQIDYLSAGSHKWLMGMEGLGLLYVRPERAKALVPRTAGWLSHENAEAFLRFGPGHLRYDRPFKVDARMVEGGSQNVLGCAALEASLESVLSLGVEKIFAHVQRYHDALEPALKERGFSSWRSADVAQRSGILSATVPPGIDPVALWLRLVDAGVACALPDGLLRLSPHWPNSLDEVPHIVRTLDSALAEQRSAKS
jgi:cysteine desulfurase/selenocysteine lyase